MAIRVQFVEKVDSQKTGVQKWSRHTYIQFRKTVAMIPEMGLHCVGFIIGPSRVDYSL